MKKSRFSEEQIVGVLKEAEAGVPVKDLCRRIGISDATFYHWKASKETEAVVAALSRHVRKLPATLRRSLTWDRGLEMAKHKDFTVATGVCMGEPPWCL